MNSEQENTQRTLAHVFELRQPGVANPGNG
jgi:hypothetical protein